MALSSTEARVLDALDLEGLLSALDQLMAFDTSAGGETPAQEWMAATMAGMGLEVDRWELDLPALRRHPAYTEELDRESAIGVVGRLRGTAPVESEARTLVLNGHVDVVPAGQIDRWSAPPFAATLREGRVYGRGAADMKGGLLCALCAVQALIRAGAELAGSVLIHSVVGEEDGGLGTLAAIQRGHTGTAAIVLEPTGLVVAPAQAGALNFRVTVPGRAAHGALRAEGVDPIHHFIPLYRALQELETRRNARPRHPLFADHELPYALCIGRVSAGIWASTVAEQLTFEGRLGIAPDEDARAARAELAGVLDAVARTDPWLRQHPPILAWWGAQFAPAATDPRDPLVTTLRGAHLDATGAAAAVHGMPYGADMRLLVNQGGMPTVLYGPGDVRQAHAPDEYVEVAELEAAARALALTILRYCGGTTVKRTVSAT
ncbi:MAG: ArgE/DapE family deacylase [Gemmatimonadota bacterium]